MRLKDIKVGEDYAVGSCERTKLGAPLNEDDLRQQAIDGIFDSIRSAGHWLDTCAFANGRGLTKPEAEKRSEDHRQAAKAFDALVEEVRTLLGQALHDCGAQVVHETGGADV